MGWGIRPGSERGQVDAAGAGFHHRGETEVQQQGFIARGLDLHLGDAAGTDHQRLRLTLADGHGRLPDHRVLAVHREERSRLGGGHQCRLDLAARPREGDFEMDAAVEPAKTAERAHGRGLRRLPVRQHGGGAQWAEAPLLSVGEFILSEIDALARRAAVRVERLVRDTPGPAGQGERLKAISAAGARPGRSNSGFGSRQRSGYSSQVREAGCYHAAAHRTRLWNSPAKQGQSTEDGSHHRPIHPGER